MVERLNGRISDLLQQTRFDSRANLEATLLNHLKLYNHHIPQPAIGAKTPIRALNEWQQKKPELFVKRGYDQTELDTYLPLASTVFIMNYEEAFEIMLDFVAPSVVNFDGGTEPIELNLS